MENSAKHRKNLLITGSSGYLAQLCIDRVLDCGLFDEVVGLDVRAPDEAWCDERSDQGKFHFIRCDVRDYTYLKNIFCAYRPDTVLHLAWVFNPTPDHQMQHAVDVAGSLNVFDLCFNIGKLGVPVRKIVYLGSTTAYVDPANPDEPPFLTEDQSVSGTPRYLYSKHKAEVDACAQAFMNQFPEILFTLIRGSIIIGSHTKNIVSQIADWHLPGMKKFMFQVRGFDPPMQFLSEEDFVEILFRSLAENHPGIFNVAGNGTIRYGEIIEMLEKKPLALPPRLIYPATEVLWRTKLCPFPSGILDLIRYPWVADTAKLRKEFGYEPKKTSREAFEEFAATRRK